MSGNIRLYNSSGYVELQAPSDATSQVLELPTDSIKPGLVLLAQESFSAVSSVSVDGCFSSEYDNYLLILPMVSLTSSSAETQLRFRASGTDATTSNYFFQQLYSATTTTGSSSNTGTYLTIHGSGGLTAFSQVLLMSPFSAVPTGYRSDGYVGAPQGLQRWGVHTLSSSYDGVSLIFSAGTATGSLSIYGYRNS